MFGNLTANRNYLSLEEDARYRAAYCGLCRSIRSRYGQLAGFTLNYDLCFLIFLLQSLYEAEEDSGTGTCIPHPVNARPWWQCQFTEYAADMNMALGYLKLLDNWEDDGSLPSLAASSYLRNTYKKILQKYPRQCTAMKQSLDSLSAIEQQRDENPDAAAETFALMMAEVFVYREDRWAETLRGLGASLGRFLYILDAALDLDRDTVRNSYNPFRRYYGLPDNEDRFRDILKMLLGDVLQYFDRLPLVSDAGILKNILCFGLWINFDKKYVTNRDE